MSELEPELLAFIHVTPGPYPDVEDPCGHTFAQHAWDYEGAGECDGKRSALYEWENAEDGPFNCNCARSPAAIEIEWLRAELKSASVPVLETPPPRPDQPFPEADDLEPYDEDDEETCNHDSTSTDSEFLEWCDICGERVDPIGAPVEPVPAPPDDALLSPPVGPQPEGN